MGKTITYLFIVVIVGGVFAGIIYFLRPYLNPLRPSGVAVENKGEGENKGTVSPTPVKEKVSEITLEVTSPKDKTVVDNPKLVLKGKTLPLAEVFVNEIETKADTEGYFSVSLTLDEGENTIIVAVNDTNGQFAEEELTITYQPK